MKTFAKGGVHPAENKIAANAPIEVMPIPKKAYIPASQHLGAPATVVVKRGDIVKTGTLLAKGEAFISANIHSSVSGKVAKIDNWIDTSGYKRQMVIIDVDGDEWEESIDKSQDIKREITLSKEEIITRVKEMGVVGLGGATFPSHVKLMVPEGKKCEALLINGVECEPYLTSDHRVMLERGEEMLIGIKILMKALDVDTAMVGIENNKPDAIEHLNKLVKDYPGISIHPLKVKYPQGAEKQLIKALINREVPSGKLPLEVGAVVNNSGTALAVYEAVQKNKPLFERVVTVTGKSVSKPSNFLVRVGTPVTELIEKAGGLPEDTGKIINGGPMMGKAITSTDVPVTKGSSGILLMQKKESGRQNPLTCIRCGKCISACPMGLEPFHISLVARHQKWEDAEKAHVMDCIECGSCQFICPSARPLLDYMRLGKQTVGQIIRNRGKK